jgi:hypothetical protein
VSDYYLTNNDLPNNDLPVYEMTYTKNDLTKVNSGIENCINSNDNDTYYVIDLSKLDNLTLNYGRNYLVWDNATSMDKIELVDKENNIDNSDVYVINEKTHRIYYVRGIAYKNTWYFTKNTGADNIYGTEVLYAGSSSVYTIGVQSESITTNLEKYSYSSQNESEKITNNINISVNKDNDKLNIAQIGYLQSDEAGEKNQSIDTSLLTTFDKADLAGIIDDTTSITTYSVSFESRTLQNGNYYLYVRLIDSDGLIYEYYSKEIEIGKETT